jgi:hypothetical protein
LKFTTFRNSQNSSPYITFLKGYDAGFPKNSKLSINFGFEKKIRGGSLCTLGAAGIWPVVFFGTTYFGEINIFGLSKDKLSESDPLS